MGINGASMIRGLRLGFSEFVRGCFASLGAAHPFQDRICNQVERELEAIPKLALDEILGPRKTTIKLNSQKYEDGMLPRNDAVALLSILTAENPKEILEIGTYMGHTAKAMAENLPDSIIHTVDLPPDFFGSNNAVKDMPKDDFHLIQRRSVGREFKGSSVEARIKQHFGDTALMDFREFGGPVFFFIDGSHTYEYCKQDSEKCFGLCRGNGIFLWHDCDQTHPGVVKFIIEWRVIGRNICRIEGTSLAYWNGKREHKIAAQK
ncbi:MAG TPA: class I SAM-dependent methyltransferase [Verrucomicrobiae bacterium]